MRLRAGSAIATLSLNQFPSLCSLRAPISQSLPHSHAKVRLLRLRPLCVSSSSAVSTHSPPRTDNVIDPKYLSCSLPEKKPLRVAVLVSGGVDSSVALRLLHAAGHSCTAFYLKIWFQVRACVCSTVVVYWS